MLTQHGSWRAVADVFGNWQTAASVQEPSPRVTAEEFREAFSRVASSVSIVSTDGPHGIAGVTCSAVCSVSDAPPTVMVCVNRKSAANAVIKANGVLCVNWLGADQIDAVAAVCRRRAGADGRTLCRPALERARHRRPYCTHSRLALDCRVAECRGSRHPQRDLLAEVMSTVHATDGDPLVYHSRNYATIRTLA